MDFGRLLLLGETWLASDWTQHFSTSFLRKILHSLSHSSLSLYHFLTITLPSLTPLYLVGSFASSFLLLSQSFFLHFVPSIHPSIHSLNNFQEPSREKVCFYLSHCFFCSLREQKPFARFKSSVFTHLFPWFLLYFVVSLCWSMTSFFFFLPAQQNNFSLSRPSI